MKAGEIDETHMAVGNNAQTAGPKRAREPVPRAATVADDQRQMAMDLVGRAEFNLDNATVDDVAQVEEVLSDLGRLEGEISGSFGSTAEATESLHAR
jgi:hypothetical protein